MKFKICLELDPVLWGRYRSELHEIGVVEMGNFEIGDACLKELLFVIVSEFWWWHVYKIPSGSGVPPSYESTYLYRDGFVKGVMHYAELMVLNLKLTGLSISIARFE